LRAPSFAGVAGGAQLRHASIGAIDPAIRRQETFPVYSPADLVFPSKLFEMEFDDRLPYATRVNSREAYPGVLRPLDLTAVQVPNDHGIRRQLRDLGIHTIDPPGLLTTRVHQGRLYTNLSWVLWMADMLPGASAADFEAQLFGQHIPFRITRPGITRGDRVRARIFAPRFYVMCTASLAVCEPRLHRHLARRAAMQLAKQSDAQLDASIEPYQQELMIACDWNTRATIFGLIMISALSRVTGPQRATHIIPILSDLGDIESAAPARRIREVAQLAKSRTPALGEALARSERRWEALADLDPSAHLALRAVVDRYGYRSVAEFLISAPSWSEDPTPVIDAFAGLLKSGVPDNSSAAGARSAAHAALLAGLDPIRRALVRILIRGAHAGARARECAKACLIIRVDMLRKLFREVGSRLVAQSRIDALADLYFLSLEEVRAVLQGDSSMNLRELCARRRREVARLEALPEPELICGSEAVSIGATIYDSERSVFTGLGVSGGRVEGRARVVLDTDDLDAFEPGEILVAPHTDAGWTPYFALAAGVIVETGGLLTHTSTVARELGLPAIVNVRECTTMIRTGDQLRLDPGTGEVTVVARTAGQPLHPQLT
jgi:phosphohistidine swiveling domain-containing protein